MYLADIDPLSSNALLRHLLDFWRRSREGLEAAFHWGYTTLVPGEARVSFRRILD